ncbi:MAG: alkaline phosphatase family protein [Candidatus Omnitrophica bacterium]|nr:alkaline phosphatase family protein [Candidatus Omnitrophota bacterium]
MISKKWKLIIIGIDGVDWGLVQSFLRQGHLDNFNDFCQKGISLMLESTIPPISPVAWTTLLSGLNPGKHGIYDWSVRKEGSYQFRLADSSCLNVPMFWDILSAQGLSMTAFNFPLSYPPKKINGHMISGILTPSTNADFTYPRQLAMELRSLGYRIGMQQTYTAESEGIFYKDLMETLELRLKTVRYLLENHPQDAGAFLISESDFAQHKFWKYLKDARKSDPQAPDNPILEVYKRIDAFLGEISSSVDEDTNIVVLSDHGFCALKKVFCVNAWLAKHDFLVTKEGAFLKLRNRLDNFISVPSLHSWINKLRLGRILTLIPKQSRNNLIKGLLSFDDVDWSKTSAYASGALNQIYINLKGREPRGYVDVKQREEVLKKIEKAFSQLKDPVSGSNIKVKCMRAEDIYCGDKLKLAPDIHFNMDDYSYISTKRLSFKSAQTFRDSEYEDSGTHSPQGVFFAKGPNIAAGVSPNQGSKIEAIEVLPTLLYLLGAKIPRHLDGKINTSVIDGKKMVQRPPVYCSLGFSEKKGQKQPNKDPQAAEERLRGLGYID